MNKYHNLLNELITISNSINVLYERLMNLEIDNNKDSDEYKKNFDYLSISLEIEKKIFKKIDDKTAIELVSLILNDKLPFNFCGNVDSIINEKYNNKGIRRILNKLNICIDYDDQIYFKSDDQVENFNENIFMPIPDLPKENNSISPSILVAEFESIIYSFIIDIISKHEKLDNKELIKYKYNMAFINNFFENKLINNNFILPKKEISSTNEDEYIFDILVRINKKRNHYYADIAHNFLIELYNFSNDDYKNENNSKKIIIIANLIDYIIQELNENEVNDLKLKYKYDVEYKDDNSMSNELIETLFKKDK